MDETKKVFDEELSRVKQYLGWLRENVTNYNASLLPGARTSGGPALPTRGTGARNVIARHRDPPCAFVKRARVVVCNPPKGARPRAAGSPGQPREYHVALSFAGENRAYVEEVANGLRAAGVNVFYDEFEKASLWGKNLVDHLADIYQNRSRYVVLFISEFYVQKAWPKHERQHAQARPLLAKEEYSSGLRTAPR